MVSEDRINLLARLAKSPHATVTITEGTDEPSTRDASILTLAAASYGSRPAEEATIPTGFDPFAAALFESIVEGAFLVACADGIFDDEERRTFTRVVTVACGGAVPPQHIDSLISDLEDQLAEDGLDRRLEMLSAPIQRPEHAGEVLRVAALLAQCSEDVNDAERDVLEKLATACKLGPGAVDHALADVRAALGA